MGLQKGIGLVEALVKQKTFMRVARAAARGKCALKNGEVSGKQAVQFFDRLPIVSDLTGNIPAKDIVVKFGTKGNKGQSVTGFQIFNGENLVARGAMGIDKTRGRQPILQMRLLVGENGKAAKLNFSYNGNNTFNGNASSHQVLKNGKFSLSQHYGETCHLEYSESPLHYDLLTNTCGRSLRNIDELPTAYQFEQFQAQLNQRVENFVSGKSKAKQKAELKEKRRLRHQEKQVLKFELESLKSKYEPEIKKLKAKIEEL